MASDQYDLLTIPQEFWPKKEAVKIKRPKKRFWARPPLILMFLLVIGLLSRRKKCRKFADRRQKKVAVWGNFYSLFIGPAVYQNNEPLTGSIFGGALFDGAEQNSSFVFLFHLPFLRSSVAKG